MPRHVFPMLILTLSLLALPGCGGGSWSYDVVGTQRDPGAQGRVQVERIDGGNRLLTVTLEHMTPPARLGSNLTTFVMWFRDSRGQSTKASVLEYDADSRTARATATTPSTRFTLLITAERDPEVVGPSENVVFSQAVETD